MMMVAPMMVVMTVMVVVPAVMMVVKMMMPVAHPVALLDPAPAIPDRTADVTNVLHQVVLRGSAQSGRTRQGHRLRATAGK
jgi:hypothetical protein